MIPGHKLRRGMLLARDQWGAGGPMNGDPEESTLGESQTAKL